jgi:RHS repeat-associated protein
MKPTCLSLITLVAALVATASAGEQIGTQGGTERQSAVGTPDRPDMASGVPEPSGPTATGAYPYTIPFDLPPFRGLEPRLALQYQSGSANGDAGVGWHLAVSSVEIRSEGKGIATEARGHVPVLDGQSLRRCASLPAGKRVPGCTFKSEDPSLDLHFAEQDSGLRIAFDRDAWTGDPLNPNEGWVVVRQDGTRYDHRAIRRLPESVPFAYLLSTVTDPMGNQVRYHYTPYSEPYRYLAGITYNGVKVTLFWEKRPDVTFSAHGHPPIAHMRYRLRTVLVEACTLPASFETARAYALVYTTSGSTGESLLKRVQEFGADVVVDRTSGAVLNAATATRKAPFVFQYASERDYPPRTGPNPSTALPPGQAKPAGFFPAAPQRPIGNAYVDMGINTPYVLPAGFVFQGAEQNPFPPSWQYGEHIEHLKGDFNGDGIDDHVIAVVGTNLIDLRCYLGGYTGYSEFLCLESGTTVRTDVSPFSGSILVADLTGEGRADLLVIGRQPRLLSYNDDLQTFEQLEIAVGAGGWRDHQTGCARGRTLAGDVNGDGLADIVQLREDGSSYKLAASLSDGEERRYATDEMITPWFASPRDHFLLADVNGDGRKDVVLVGSDKAATPPPPNVPPFLPVCYRRYGSTGRDQLPNRDPHNEKLAPPNGSKLRICVALADFGPQLARHAFYKMRCLDDPQLVWNEYVNPDGPPPPNPTNGQWLAADLNGDGREDIVSISPISPGTLASRIHAWVSQTGGFLKRQPETDIPLASASSYFSPWTIIDLDGDRRSDLVRYVDGFGFQSVLARGLPNSVNVTFESVPMLRAVPAFPFGDIRRSCFGGWPAPRGTTWDCRNDGLRSVDFAADGKGNYRVVAWGFVGPGEPKKTGGGPCNDLSRSTNACDEYHLIWQAKALVLPTPVLDPARWLSLDVDGDGLFDRVMVTSREAEDLHVHTRLRRGAGAWVAVESVLPGTRDYSPLMAKVGDFDGDGRDDLAFVRVTMAPLTAILLARFDATARRWKPMGAEHVSNFVNSPDAAAWHVGDQNGDGRDDLLHVGNVRDLVEGTVLLRWQTYLSDGKGALTLYIGFTGSLPWDLRRWSYPFHVADVDGDGAADLVSVYDVLDRTRFLDGQKVFVLHSSRDGRFEPFGGQATNGGSFRFHNPSHWAVVDANGDGASDLAYVGLRDVHGPVLQEIFIDLLMSSGLRLFPYYGNYQLGFGEPLGAYRLADANGDGKTDLVGYSFVEDEAAREADLLVTWYPLPRPPSYPPGPPLVGSIPSAMAFPVYAGLTSMDIDRDTWTELELLVGEAANFQVTSLFQKAAYNYLSKAKNPLGGATGIAYRTLVERDPVPGGDCILPPFAAHVVASTGNDARDVGAGRVPVGTQREFTYRCPRWSGAEREFHGFRTVVEEERQLLSDGTTAAVFPNREPAKVITTYDLTDACGARVLSTVTENAGRSLRDESASGFLALAPGETAPFDCRPVSQTSKRVEPGGTVEMVSTVTYTRDELGEIEWAEESGDAASEGDERTTRIVRTIDADPATKVSSGYIVTVAREELFQGTKEQAQRDPDRNRLRATYSCYDARVAFDAPRPKATRLTECSQSALPARPRGLLTARLHCIDVHSGKCPATLSSDFTLGADIAGSRVDFLAVTTFAHDAVGNVTESVDPRGAATTLTYDDPFPRSIYLSEARDALGHKSVLKWDWAKGLLTEDRDPETKVRSVFDYDPLGRLIQRRKVAPGSMRDEDHLVTRIEYHLPDPPAPTQQFIKTIEDDHTPDGRWSLERLDGLARVTRTEREGSPDPDSGAAVVAFQDMTYSDDSTRPWIVTDVYPSTGAPRTETFVYDALGRNTELRRPGHPAHGSVKVITEHRLEAGSPMLAAMKVTDEAGHVHTIAVDAFGRTVRVDEPGKTAVVSAHFRYNAADDLLSTRGPAGDATTYAHDHLGRVTREVDPDRGETLFSYDLADNVVRTVDANRVEITMEHDAVGRLTSKTDSKTGRRLSFFYDSKDPAHGAGNAGWGRLTLVRDSAATGCGGGGTGLDPIAMSFGYDLLGRPVRKEKCWAGLTMTTRASYDRFGRLASVVYPEATPEVIIYEYDAGGRTAKVANTAGTVYVSRITYDAAGRLRDTNFGNGVVQRNQYDSAWRRLLEKATLRESGGATDLYAATYGYTSDQLIKSIRVDGTLYTPYSLAYAYDGQHRITGKTGFKDESFVYDDLGNLTSATGATYTYPTPGPGVKQLHAIASATLPTGTYSFSHDPAGNLEKITEPGGDRKFTWDGDNRLRKVTFGTADTTMAYDAFGERIEKTAAGRETRFFFAPTVEVSRSGGDKLIKYYFVEGRLIARREGEGLAGPLRFHHQDHVGSTVAVTDEAGKKVAGSEYRYLAYGPLAETKKPEEARDMLFTGARHDFETAPAGSGEELVYLESRYYLPAFGRFISADPVVPRAAVMALNRYTYASGNPISRVDPTGNIDQPADLEPPKQAGEIVAIGSDRMIAVPYEGGLAWADYSEIHERDIYETAPGGSPPQDVSPIFAPIPASPTVNPVGQLAAASQFVNTLSLPEFFVLGGAETHLAKFFPKKVVDAMPPRVRSILHRSTAEALVVAGWKPRFGSYIGIIYGGGATLPRSFPGHRPVTESVLFEDIWSTKTWEHHREVFPVTEIDSKILKLLPVGGGTFPGGGFGYYEIGKKSIFAFVVGAGIAMPPRAEKKP